MDYGFTAKIEEEFDEIAGGRNCGPKWSTVFKAFKVISINDRKERIKGERELGVEAGTGRGGCKNGAFWTDGANR